MTLCLILEMWDRFWCSLRPPQTLCAFRIVFGLVLLEYCYLTAPEFLDCYGTHGILRLESLSKIFAVPVINFFTVLPPSDSWSIVFFCIFVIACFCLTIGLLTRLSSIAVYLGLVSLLHRNIYVAHSGIHLMVIIAFFLMFSPAGASYSVDRLRRSTKRFERSSEVPPLLNIWGLQAIKVQIALIYWQASVSKLGSPSWWDGSALYYVFRDSEFWRFPVPLIPDNLFLCQLLTWSSILIELAGWTLIWFKQTRYAVLGALVLLHLGIEYAMNIPIFEHIMLASLVTFVPAQDVARVLGKIIKESRRWNPLLALSAGSTPDSNPASSTAEDGAISLNQQANNVGLDDQTAGIQAIPPASATSVIQQPHTNDNCVNTQNAQAMNTIIPAKRKLAAIQLLIAFFLSVALIHVSPPGPLHELLENETSMLTELLSFNQHWGMFADLRDYNVHGQAFITFADRSVKLYDCTRLDLEPPFSQWQHGKMREYWIDSMTNPEKMKHLYPVMARRMARANAFPGNEPVHVSLAQAWSRIPPMDGEFTKYKDLPQDFNRSTFLPYSVQFGDLK